MAVHSQSFYVTLPSSANYSVYPENTLAYYYNELAVPIDFKDKKYEVALVEFILEGEAGNMADMQMSGDNLYRVRDYADSSLYIYSNICEPQMFGPKNLRVLRVFPVRKSWTVLETPHYVPVCMNTIPRILIDIRDVEGNRFSFRNGHAIVKLHFKEVFPTL